VSIRMPPSNSPVTDVTSDDITCNVNGNKVPSGVNTTAANAGDNITVQWDSSSHPGPIQHYLFGPVDDASEAAGVGSWFKIDEFVQDNGTWANAIMEQNNMTYSFNLPADLASGEYLLRSEMLALHGSQSLGGAQWYIGCAQLKITGTAGDSCTPSIQLPGAYEANATDIYIANFYDGFNISTYVPPGGAVATCGAGGSNGGSSAIATTAASTTAAAVSSIATSTSVVSGASSIAVSSAASTTSAPTTLITAVVPSASSAAATSSAVTGGDDSCDA